MKVNRWKKTAPMLIHKVSWYEIAEELDIKYDTLSAWRKSGDPNKNEAIDYAINQIINYKEVSSN